MGSDSRTGLSVVIPTLNEERHLPRLLDDLASWDPSLPTVVVDGGSVDDTRRLALQRGCRVLYTHSGRGRQMNVGAGVAETPWILFLHADSRIDAFALDQARAFAGDTPGAACFRLAIDHPAVRFRLIEWGQRLRDRWLDLPYGDQGLLIHLSLLEAVGGVPRAPLMEDVLLVKRLARHGVSVTRLPAPVRTSPRRYLESGSWRQVAQNAWRISRFLMGVPPDRLASSYPDRAPEAASSGTTPAGDEGRDPPGAVAVFAKAPLPGRVKTRLAAGIGQAGALAVYEHLLTTSLAEARASGARVVLCHDAEDGRGALETRFGPAVFRYQGDGDLGERMNRMLSELLADGAPAVVMGTDIPGLDRTVLRLAFRALAEADVVLGPSFDGGYYLVGLNRPAPELFRDMEWSTSGVLAETRRRARVEGLTVLELEPLRDVDEAADLTDDLRRIAESGTILTPEEPPEPRSDR